MNTSLHVRVLVPSFESQVGFPVVGNIRPLERGGDRHRNVLIPVGPDGVYPAVFPVKPGRYMVEAVLPSGMLLSDEVDVAEGTQAEVNLHALDSPQETHSWQFILGNVAAGPEYHTRTVPVPNSVGSRVGPTRPNRGEADGLDSIAAARVTSWVADGTGSAAPSFSRLNEVARQLMNPTETDDSRLAAALGELGLARSPAIGDLRVSDGITEIYDFGGENHQLWDGALTRRFVSFVDDFAAYLVTVPTPWTRLDGEEEVIEVLVNSRQSGTGSAISVTVRDREVGTALAYLASGALTKAAVVFGDVQRMLFGKRTNPLAAAAGAYVLVGTDLADRRQGWDEWLKNLRTWFPEMSDGSILWAARQLRLAKNAVDLDQARLLFLEGYGRGLPVFTLGLGWLIEGLSQFPEDPECEQALNEVRRTAWIADTREPFLVLRLSQKDHS